MSTPQLPLYAPGSPDAPVLIVDDNAQFTKILVKMLQGVFGYREVVSVTSTEEGYQKIKSQPGYFQVLFCDFRFPEGTTGVQLLRRLKDEGLSANITSFLITSEPSVDNTKEAQAAGARGAIAKPFDRREIERQFDKVRRETDLKSGESF